MNIFTLTALLGGLAFFLFGMQVMSHSLEKVAGGRLESVLKKMTANPFKALLFGAGITAMIQSSSAMTVMLVGLVNSGIMNITQAVGVIMGSNVGTTITSWLLSLTGIKSGNLFLSLLKPKNFSPVLAFIGIILIMSKKSVKRADIGSVFIGFSVLMTGMEIMSSAVEPIAEYEGFQKTLTAFSNPFFGVLAGAIFTAVIQSSSASVGILQALAITGTVPYSVAIPIILGQNIGTCITPVLSAIGTEKNAKQVAVIHVSFNLIGTMIFLLFFYGIQLIFPFEFLQNPITPFAIAGFHTIFNIITTALLLPFSNRLVRLASFVIRSDAGQRKRAPMQAEPLQIDGIQNSSPQNNNSQNGTIQNGNLQSRSPQNNNTQNGSMQSRSMQTDGTRVDGMQNRRMQIKKMQNDGKENNNQRPGFADTASSPADTAGRGVLLDSRLLISPHVAVIQCRLRTREMAVLAKESFFIAVGLLNDYNEDSARKIMENERKLDRLEDALGAFMLKLNAEALTETESNDISILLHTIIDFERIGDRSVNIMETAKKIHEKQLKFTDAANRELSVMTKAAKDLLDLTLRCFTEKDSLLSKKVEPLEEIIDMLSSEIKRRHINRLRNGECSAELGIPLNDLLTNLERIGDHCSNIAVCLIQIPSSKYSAHDYLEKIKKGENPEFIQNLNEYGEIYRLD